MNWSYSEAFAGIGAWGKAIKIVTERHNDTCTLKRYWEIDKYASNAFSAIHGESEDLNLWDITKDMPGCPTDVFFYSPPCQTFSIAGKREGTNVNKGNLFYAAMQNLEKAKPKYAIMENVKGLPSGDTKKDFNAMLWYLESLGYYNYWKVLNTKDYGVPQNRERVFIVSVRSDIYDKGKRFEFPKPFKLELTLKDMLEEEVDDKYYLSDEYIRRFLKNDLTMGSDIKIVGTTVENPEEKGTNCRHWVHDTSGIVGALSVTENKQPKQILIGESRGRNNNDGDIEQNLEINKEGTSNALTSVQKDNYVIQLQSGHKKGYTEAYPGDCINLDQPNSDTNRNRVPGKVSSTLTTACNVGFYNGLSIRKLTPLECFRLQGFSDYDYYKAVESYDNTYTKGSSDTQMYKRAGNSITVNVIVEILENLLYDREQDGQQLSLF